ncbi:MAG: 50S ribosomal protein L1 [Chloroflexi bacterium RBG_13_48_17]|nr:MAG: 50S ribosomal protein L1 [Chloroflexi bacterium RBG_13_48_17]
MVKHGKKYEASVTRIDKATAYQPKEAIGLVKKSAPSKFDETVELHLRMGLDPRNAAQQLRGVALLPHGLGKKVRVLVFAQGEAERIASGAGADYVGGDDMIKKVEEGWVDFDTAIAVPEMMGKVGKLGKILGRKGLMPNPKSGTVVGMNDLPRVIEDARKGRVEYKLDKTAIIHVPLGKVSFEEQKLMDNLTAIMEAVVKAKPAGAKGQYVKSVYITTTMGPSVKLDITSAMALSAS